MHYLVASWDPSLRLEQPARDVGDLPWSMVLCIFPCVPVFSPKVLWYWDVLGLVIFLWSWTSIREDRIQDSSMLLRYHLGPDFTTNHPLIQLGVACDARRRPKQRFAAMSSAHVILPNHGLLGNSRYDPWAFLNNQRLVRIKDVQQGMSW